MGEVEPSSRAREGADAGRLISVSLMSAVKTVLALLSADVDSEERLFKAVTTSLDKLGVRGAVMLREGDGQALRVVSAATHPVIAQVERLAGLRTHGYRFDAAKAEVYRRVLAGIACFEEDSRVTLDALVPDAAKPFTRMLRVLTEGTPGIYVPLWRSGQVVGAINVAGAHLTRDDLPAIEGVAAAVSVGLQNISLLRAHRSSQPAQELSTRVLQATLQGEALETTLRSTVQALMGTDPRWRGLAITRLDESERLEVLAASGDERLVTQVLAGCERRSWTSWWAQHQHVRCTTCGVTTCALAGIASVPITGRTRMHAGVLTERLFGVLFAHAEGRTEAELTEELSPLAAALGTVLARAEAEHARARADAHLLQAQRLEAVGQLAGGIAHDFNNLLTGIQLSAALIHEDLAPEARIRADIEDILAECDRGARLTRQLLMFGRRHALAPRPLDVGEVAQQMMRLFNRLLGEDIRLVLEVPDPRWSTTADPGALEQLLMNLVVNSRDAMPDGGTITVRVTNHEGIAPPLASKEARAAGDYLCIAVVDTGVGMDEATRARVFEPFFTTKGERGTGLGLAVVYGVVQEAGGWIEVDSKPGRGTTFRAWLPRTLVVGGEERRVARPPPTQKTSVLLVEDDKALAQRVARLLMREGHEVTVVHDVAGARAAAARLGDTLDVVVSDVILPDGTGVTLAAGLRDQHPALRVLLMSGYLDDKNRHAEINRGDWAFLAKPFNSIELLTSLRALIS